MRKSVIGCPAHGASMRPGFFRGTRPHLFLQHGRSGVNGSHVTGAFHLASIAAIAQFVRSADFRVWALMRLHAFIAAAAENAEDISGINRRRIFFLFHGSSFRNAWVMAEPPLQG